MDKDDKTEKVEVTQKKMNSDKIIDNKYGNNQTNTITADILNVEDFNNFIEERDNQKQKDNWTKLDKTSKVSKLNEFVDTIYGPENNLSLELIQKCKLFLIDLLDKKRLVKSKDIVYNKLDYKITSIPCMTYSKLTNKFGVNNEKRVSTTLKSLPNFKKLKKNKTSKNHMSVDASNIIISIS